MKDAYNTKDDPFQWLETEQSSQVEEWLEGQSEISNAYFTNLPQRSVLVNELSAIFATDTVGIPIGRLGNYFFTKRMSHQEMAVLYVQEGLTGTPRVLIDPVTLSTDNTAALVGWYPSKDGQLLVYEVSAAGNDKNDIRVMNVTSGKQLHDYIDDDGYPCFESWANDSSGFWYTKRDHRVEMVNPVLEEKLYCRLYFRTLGTPIGSDEMVFGDVLDRDCRIGAIVSDDGRYLKVDVYGQDAVSQKRWNEIYLCDLEQSPNHFVKVIDRKPGFECSARLHRNVLYVVTNEGAPRFQVLSMPVSLSETQLTPRVCVPEGVGTIEQIVLVGDALFVCLLEDVHSVIRQYDLYGMYESEIELPTIGAVTGYSCEREGSELFYSFQSFSVPPSIYRRDLVTGETTLFAQTEAGFDTSLIETKQLWFESNDGTKVPMFVVHKQGMALTGDNPTVLYGYGGFDVSLRPSFMKTIIPFVRRGGIYVVANLRGGGEFGHEWHEAGVRYNKQNVFDDFASAARYLITAGYTRKEKLAIKGGSNGGLLTMATITQHPDLVQAAVASVPVTDMLRYHCFNGGLFWIPDYGDPDDADMCAYLRQYSPYHNVRDGEHYPSVLIMTSDHDDRVHPMHSYKMAARLQEANASQFPVILRVESQAGHGGAGAVSKLVASEADLWSFVFKELQVEI